MQKCIVLVLTTFITFTSADYCQDNFTLSDFPKGILDNIISIALHETIVASDCSKSQVDKDSIKLWYWNRQNPEIPQLLNNINPKRSIDPRPTILLVPGWLCNVTNDRMPELRKAYLQRYDCSIIGVDWSAYSIDTYGNSYCKVPLIAKIVAGTICQNRWDVSKMHIVGHSMGAHLAGLIGQEVQSQCGYKINRITGLDPSGPVYQTDPPAKRLDATDANSVDIIHTDEGVFGYLGSCGTTDFFPNCGVLQPGCLKLDLTDISKIINLPLNAINCNHLRSADYMIESINFNGFESKSSSLLPTLCLQDLFANTAYMGEDCPATTPSRNYLLTTNDKPPYARG